MFLLTGSPLPGVCGEGAGCIKVPPEVEGGERDWGGLAEVGHNPLTDAQGLACPQPDQPHPHSCGLERATEFIGNSEGTKERTED